MIIGTHTILYSKDADADRTFFRDVLGLRSVDAGHGWLIFESPPSEIAVHPAEDTAMHAMYLMCENLDETIAELKTQGIACGEIVAAGWGRMTEIALPSGAKLGLYQPRHALAISLPTD